MSLPDQKQLTENQKILKNLEEIKCLADILELHLDGVELIAGEKVSRYFT